MTIELLEETMLCILGKVKDDFFLHNHLIMIDNDLKLKYILMIKYIVFKVGTGCASLALPSFYFQLFCFGH